MRIAVIGAGTMGSGIAGQAALHGADALLWDAEAAAVARGLERAGADLSGAVDRGKLSAADADAARGRLHGARTLPEAVDGADVVVEAIVEAVGPKQDVLTQAEAAAPPGALLATNTSALSVTEIMAALQDPGRGLGAHFFNPVRAMKLCEIVVGAATRPETVEAARDFAAAVGKTAVVVADVAGFATSRISATVGNEALRMLEAGVASAEDLDTAVRLGLGHPMGPLELADVVGLDVRLAVLERLRDAHGDAYRPATLLRTYVAAGRLGAKTGRGIYRWEDGRRVPGSGPGPGGGLLGDG